MPTPGTRAHVPDCGRLRLKDVPVQYQPPARRPEHRKSKGRDDGAVRTNGST